MGLVVKCHFLISFTLSNIYCFMCLEPGKPALFLLECFVLYYLLLSFLCYMLVLVRGGPGRFFF